MKAKIQSPGPFVLATLASLLLTVALYGSALRLPFYSDDLLQVPWVESTPMSELWRTVGPYRDYRPLLFSLWRLVYLAMGDLQPAPLHVLNLAGHALCGGLAGLLAARWGRRRRLVAALGAGLFAGFPFAFDAVPWAIGLSYPLAVSLALGALLTYLRARTARRQSIHLAAVAMTLLAGFAHEGAAVAGVIVLWAELAAVRRNRRFSLWPLAHLTASALPLVVAALVRPQGTELHGLAWPDLGLNAAFALQALVFPVAPLAEWLGGGWLSLMVVGAPVLAATIAIVRRSVGWRPIALALGWWAIWCLPPLLTLRFAWLRDAPRTLYPAAAGVALLWASLGTAPRRHLRAALAAGTTALLSLVPAGWFVIGRMALLRQVGDVVWNVVDLTPQDPPLLAVNLPARVTPAERFYPLGHEGVIPLPLPPRVHAGDLVTAHTGESSAAFERAWGPVLPPLPYRVDLLGEPLAPDDLAAAAQIALVEYDSNGMALRAAGAVDTAPRDGVPLARFGDRLLLLSASCVRTDGGQVVLTTHWLAESPIDGFPTFFAHLLGPDGNLLTQADGDPLRGLYPLNQWQPHQVVEDMRTFDGISEGGSVVSIGVWDPAASLRWPGGDPGGQPLVDDAFRCLIREQ
ncbi:MAG: hypothetical protein PVI59_09700 [Anaerolineae bacterium]